MPEKKNEGTVAFARHFMRAYPGRTALLVLLLALSGLAEAVGVVTLLPVLELAMAEGGSEPSPITRTIHSWLAILGIPATLGVLLGVIVLGITLKGGFRLLAMKQVGYTVAHVGTDLRLALIDALLKVRWGHFASQQTGRFGNAIASESDRAANAYKSLCSLVSSGIQAAVYLALALLISWQIALFAVVAGFLLVGVLSRLVRLAREAGASQTDLMSSLVSRLTDALQGIKPIKAMGRERHLRPLLESETRGINSAKERQVLASEALTSAQEPLLVFLLAIALYGALTIGTQPFATVLVLAFLFYRLVGRISHIQTDYQAAAVGESAFWSMMENIRGAERERESVAEEGVRLGFEREITLDSVSFRYGEAPVLTDVTLSIPAGAFVALAGPSGAGKTTVADLVVGLYRPDSGMIYVDGTKLSDMDLGAWRRSIGYVPQEMFLFHDTVYRNVTLGDEAISRERVVEALREADALSFVDALPQGLDEVLGERGSRLSGGQRQRIAIARALAGDPNLLVLDEVTTALDPQTEAGICATLRDLSGRRTILTISHQPAMMDAADLVYRLESGRIVSVDDRNLTTQNGRALLAGQ